jgi:hypothetical protein
MSSVRWFVDRIPKQFGLLPGRFGYPPSREPEGGFDSGCPLDLPIGISRIQGEQALGLDFSAADADPADLDDVFVRPKGDVVLDPYRRHKDAQLDGRLFPEHRDAIEEVASLGRVDQWNQAVPDLHAQRIDVEVVVHLFFGPGSLHFFHLFCFFCLPLRSGCREDDDA